MKKILISGILCSIYLFTNGQVNNAKTQSSKKTDTLITKSILNNLKDSASYAMGIFVVNVYQHQGITGINSSIVARAIDDLQFNKPRLLTDNEANNVVLAYLNQIQQEKSKPIIDAGEKFLEENKKRQAVITTATGLQYEVINMGSGPKPEITDSVQCNYIGTYIDGLEFDNSYPSGMPVTFSLMNVITAWKEGLPLMPVGSKFKFYVPYQLGYGASDYFTIPGGSALIFEIELVGIKGK